MRVHRQRKIYFEREGIKNIRKIDLTSSFWQVPLSEESKKFTGFLLENKVYNFRVVPFGLQNAMEALVRAIDLTLGHKVEEFTLSYVDDLICLSETFEDKHLQHLEEIFQKFQDGGLTINPRKTLFCREEVKFLGYVFTRNGIGTDPEKLNAIREFPIPTTVKQLQSFLGFVNYYSRFTSKYAASTRPLYQLLQKERWEYNAEMQQAFQAVKDLFVKSVVIAHPVEGKETFLQTDASTTAIASQLYQRNEEGEVKGNRFCKPNTKRL